ncbi:MAG: hypothetical protein V4689_21445 [Verrucomicrobiota bacterium]
MKALTLLPLLLACALSPASAAVYLNDAVIDKPENTFLGGDPPWNSYASVFLLTQSPNGFVVLDVLRVGTTTAPYQFQFSGLSIAGYYGLFSVSAGEELTFLNAASKPAGYSLALSVGQSAYIGYWSQRTGKPASPTMEANDIFGWAKITVVPPSGPNPARLTVQESASADGGIIVGTAQQIPEANTVLLAFVGTLALFRRRRNRLDASRSALLQNTATLISRAKADSLPGFKTAPKITAVETLLTDYTGEKGHQAETIRDKKFSRRAAVQHAADALWPASEEATRRIRKTLGIPLTRAMGV